MKHFTAELSHQDHRHVADLAPPHDLGHLTGHGQGRGTVSEITAASVTQRMKTGQGGGLFDLFIRLLVCFFHLMVIY